MSQNSMPRGLCSDTPLWGRRFIGLALLPLLGAAGCASMSHSEKGLLAGGGLGAATGAIVGSATGHTGAGAAIGSGLGAIAGGLTGAAIDNSERKQDLKLAAATAPPPRTPLGITDVVQLAQQHISDDIIVQQIRTTGSLFHLSANDIVWLKQNGVSDDVVREMQSTANRYPRRVYSPAPVYTQPVYVVEPPPVSLGFGLGYCGGRW